MNSAQMKTIAKTLPNTKRDWPWPVLMAFIRLPLILSGSAIAILAYQFAGIPAGLAAGLGWSTLTLTIVNLLDLELLVWRSKVEDFDLKQMIGFHRHLLVRDLVTGIAWSVLLGGLLLSGVFAVIFLLHGTNGFANLESVFIGNANFSFPLPVWMAVVSAVAFPLLNPWSKNCIIAATPSLGWSLPSTASPQEVSLPPLGSGFSTWYSLSPSLRRWLTPQDSSYGDLGQDSSITARVAWSH